MTDVATPTTSRKDWSSDQEVRWCPGCGDYSILSAVQLLMPELGVRRESTVFVSGIGCAARFPYYMNTYGLHSIHGRAPAIATGLKLARPELKVFVVTGDGDGLSIGGNHMLHLLRRNVDVTSPCCCCSRSVVWLVRRSRSRGCGRRGRSPGRFRPGLRPCCSYCSPWCQTSRGFI